MRSTPGVDGLRAVAVIAVLLYHAELRGFLVPGGFLGVDVFFVISGYLITYLLLEEKRLTGTVAVGRFYLRRNPSSPANPNARIKRTVASAQSRRRWTPTIDAFS